MPIDEQDPKEEIQRLPRKPSNTLLIIIDLMGNMKKKDGNRLITNIHISI